MKLRAQLRLYHLPQLQSAILDQMACCILHCSPEWDAPRQKGASHCAACLRGANRVSLGIQPLAQHTCKPNTHAIWT